VSLTLIHSEPSLPLPPETALAVLGVGAVVFVLVLFDLYRREVGGWP